MMKTLAVGVGGFLGSILRYQLQTWVHTRFRTDVPYGTMLVNILGSFCIGVLMSWFLQHDRSSSEWRLFLVTGILGGFTTFSSFTWEAFELFRMGLMQEALGYVGGSLLGGFAGLALGVGLTTFLSSI
jgi:CrcB protein